MEIKERYINPLTDYGFKLLFGTEVNKDLLIHFMNQLLPDKFQIEHLNYIPKEKLGDSPDDRKAFYDVHGMGRNNERYILEMQDAYLKFIKDRVLYYSSITIREQAKKGEWNYELFPIFSICILNFNFTDEKLKEKKRVVHKVYFRDQDGYIFYDKFGHFYIELPNFKKSITELETPLDKWLFLLQNLPKQEEISKVFEEPIFKKVFEVAEFANFSAKERKKYLESMKRYNDYQLTLDYKVEEGIEIGLMQSAQAVEQAQKAAQDAIMQAELEKQKAELEKRKVEQEKHKAIRALKESGFPLAKIAEIYGLTIQEVEGI